MTSVDRDVAFHDEFSHRICNDAFSVSVFEVTVESFALFIDATGYVTDAESGRGGVAGCWTFDPSGSHYDRALSWRNPGFSQSGDHPVVCVSKHDADMFTKWLSIHSWYSFRLPTEREWEAMRFYEPRHKNAICDYANVLDKVGSGVLQKETNLRCTDGFAHTAPVGSFLENAAGLFDVTGNVWEWTCSAYTSKLSAASRTCHIGGRAFFSRRGGGWIDPRRSARAGVRYRGPDYVRYNFVGFRIIRELPDASDTNEPLGRQNEAKF